MRRRGLEPGTETAIEQESSGIANLAAVADSSDTTPNPANPGGRGRLGTIPTASTDAAPSQPVEAAEHPAQGPTGAGDLDLGGVVETALARALVLAAQAGRWHVVQQIAGELEARRMARDAGAGEVIALDAERARREQW